MFVRGAGPTGPFPPQGVTARVTRQRSDPRPPSSAQEVKQRDMVDWLCGVSPHDRMRDAAR